MEMLLYSFLANILCEGMHDGVISIFKIQSIFYETCESFIQRYGTDNGADAWSKENANLKKTVSAQRSYSLNSNDLKFINLFIRKNNPFGSNFFPLKISSTGD
jgi:uncharacterized protein YheU (UPF0270 family)